MASLATDSNPIDNGIVLAWNEINDRLSPIIGQDGVEALYQRSLTLVCTDHAWLSEVVEVTSGPEKFEALQEALAKQTNVRAMSANEALMCTFHDLVAGLIGEPLAQQLIRSTKTTHYLESGPQNDAETTQVALLRQANEHLLLAALRAENAAEVAVNDFNDLARISQYDTLTGTPNRTLLLDRLERSISLARRQNTEVAVLFLDIDCFKQINDIQGHSVGDEVLRSTARCLESSVRDSDTICRYGGDEFVILLPQIHQASDAAGTAAKILTTLAKPHWIGNQQASLSASLGIAVYPQDGENAATLIDRADAAMCKAPDDRLSHRSYPLLAARDLIAQFIQEQRDGYQTA